MKIYAPVKDTNGVHASILFVKGVGETNNPALIEWFKQHGYRVEKCENTPEIPSEKCENEGEIPSETCDEPDFEHMTPNELRDWAKANGLGSVIKNTRNKEKLLEILRG